ncbi:MAG: hypothetical protein ACO3Y3_08010 [Phycisphaerales bacterium]
MPPAAPPASLPSIAVGSIHVGGGPGGVFEPPCVPPAPDSGCTWSLLERSTAPCSPIPPPLPAPPASVLAPDDADDSAEPSFPSPLGDCDPLAADSVRAPEFDEAVCAAPSAVGPSAPDSLPEPEPCAPALDPDPELAPDWFTWTCAAVGDRVAEGTPCEDPSEPEDEAPADAPGEPSDPPPSPSAPLDDASVPEPPP